MMTRQISYGAALAFTWFALGAGALGAQTTEDSERQRCERVTADVEAGRRDVLDSYGYVGNCGARGMAALVRSWGVWKRVNERAALVGFADATRFVRDAGVFDALLQVAEDPAATPAARALALRNLRVMRDPGARVPLESLEALAAALAGPDGGRDPDSYSLCGHNVSVSDVYVPPGPAPSPGDLQRLSALRRRLLTSAGTPLLVKAAATCS